MLAILNSNPILSKTGKTVYGRFYVFQKDTNQKATVYTYDENNSLVEGENPIYTDVYGYPEYKVILENQVYSIVVEEYLGDYSDPKQDDRSEMWNICNTYYMGMEVESESESSSGTVVYGLNSLADVPVDSKSVTVIGFNNSFDCEPRTYIWDDSCLLTPDAGYIIRSNEQSQGRWILLNDLPWIPSEYYGVYPGKTTNLNNLLSAPTSIVTSNNTYLIPNAIKFATGVYSIPNNITLAHDRTLIVDNETSFGDTFTVTCNGVVRLGERTDVAIGKLKLPESTPAKLSWFPSYDSFFECGSKILHIDCELDDKALYDDVTLTDCTIYFEGFAANVELQSGASLTLDNCVMNGYDSKSIGFPYTVKYQNMFYTDKYVINETTNAVLGSGLTFNASDFDSKYKYVLACKATGITTINLEGYSVDQSVPLSGNYIFTNGTMQTISCTGSVTLKNFNVRSLVTTGNLSIEDSNITSTATVQGNLVAENSDIATITVVGTSISLNKCIVNSLGITSDETTLAGTDTNINGFATIADNCTFVFNGGIIKFSSDASLTQFNAENTTIVNTNGNTLSADSMYFRNSYVNMNLNQNGTGTTSAGVYKQFIGYNDVFNGTVMSTWFNADHCIFNAGFQPVAQEIDSNYCIDAVISNCTFNGANDGITMESVNDEDQVRLNMFYVNGNTFMQTGNHDGIKLQVFVGDNRYINDDPTVHRWSWEGNSGNCLQSYYSQVKDVTVEDSASKIEDFRFIFFGINGSGNLSDKVIPFEAEFVTCPTDGSIVSSNSMGKIYILGSAWSYTNCALYQYSTSDYFLFKLGTNQLAAARYFITVKPMRRYTESNQIL